MTGEQLTLDLPHRAAFGAEDFLVSDCNLGAVRLIDGWPGWAEPAHLLIGPPSSGKTHLARVWQAKSGATPVSAQTRERALLAQLAVGAEGRALIIEDIDRAGYDEKVLFHLLNAALERRCDLLLTAREAPSRLGVALPDLLSRFNALPAIRIGAPDEALIKMVMLKHFADRQLSVEPKVLDFLALHVDRSFAAAALAVDTVDRAALASGRKITRQLVAEALGQAFAED